MTFVIHWPQAIMLGLYVIVLCCSAVLHGVPKTGKHSFWSQLVGVVIGFGLLYAGGFWS
jgi:hypothetical protein